jgi:PBP/GOBP family
MKFLLIFVCCAIFALVIAGQVSVEYAKKVQDYCKEKEDATDEDLINILNGTLPETRAEKCLGACLSERYGTVSLKEN